MGVQKTNRHFAIYYSTCDYTMCSHGKMCCYGIQQQEGFLKFELSISPGLFVHLG